jgi:probable addiction module antidote protein
LEDDDPRVFLLAVRNVVEARGGMSKIARTCKLNREGLYRMLSKKGNPSLQSLGRLLSSMGFRLAVEKKDAA